MVNHFTVMTHFSSRFKPAPGQLWIISSGGADRNFMESILSPPLLIHYLETKNKLAKLVAMKDKQWNVSSVFRIHQHTLQLLCIRFEERMRKSK